MKRRYYQAIFLYATAPYVHGFCMERYQNKYTSANLVFTRKQEIQSVIRYSSAFFEDNEITWGDDDDDDDDEYDIFLSSSSKEISSHKIEEIDDTDDSYYEHLFEKVELEVNDDHIDKEVIIEKEEQIEEKTYKKEVDVTFWGRAQKELVERKKETSKKKRRKRLETRAALLALRALRQTIKIETSYASISADEILPHKECQLYSYPVPTLSQSASLNFRRAGENDIEILALEKKLYGHRFRKAFNLYVRLLQRIEDIKLEAKKKATEMIMDEMAQKAARQSLHLSTVDDSSHASEVASLSAFSHFRLRWIAHLSLYEGTRKISGPLPSDWKNLPTTDLVSILYIRGNIGGRGRLPQTREKVVKKLEESLFHLSLF